MDFRLRNLPPKIREQRRKESRVRVYRNHKTNRIQKQKESRQNRQQTLPALFNSIHRQRDLVEQVGKTAEIAVRTEKLRKMSSTEPGGKRCLYHNSCSISTIRPNRLPKSRTTLSRGPKHRKMAGLYNAYVRTLEAASTHQDKGEEFIHWGFVVACDTVRLERSDRLLCFNTLFS